MGDLVLLDYRPGAVESVLAADMCVIAGEVHYDARSITGEALPGRALRGDVVLACCSIVRGAALAKVTAVGLQTEVGQVQIVAKQPNADSQRWELECCLVLPPSST